MSADQVLHDSLVNFRAELGTERDKGSVYNNHYVPFVLTEEAALAAYSSSWLAGKIVDLPPWDSTREWRGWQADKKQIEAIEAEEKRLDLIGKVKEALQTARLRGGCALLIGDGSRDASKPLDPNRIGKGGLKYLVLLNRSEVQPGDRETDVLSPEYNKPKWYTVGREGINVHPSRLIVFRGRRLPGDGAGDAAFSEDPFWGAPILQHVYSACQNADTTTANIASLVFEAKVDVLRVPNFLEEVADPKRRAAILAMASLNAAAKGVNGMLMIDAAMEYDSKSVQFGGTADILDRFLQIAAGAADISVTRLLMQSPGGLNSSGESDLRNYYDHVRAVQTLEIAPLIAPLDEILIRSALGTRPPEVYYSWRPLWQPTAKEQSDIGKATAETIKILNETRLWNPQALAAAGATLLVERDVVPGFEAALSDLGSDDPNEDPDADGTGLGATTVQDAAPRPLYVSRRVLNASAILAWAEEQGIPDLLPADKLHVTVTFSRTPVDWIKMGEAWNETLTVAAGGPRVIEKLGSVPFAATTLSFASSDLSWRNREMREKGASWDFEDYTPHISLTYTENNLDPDTIRPYTGPIELGPEIFEDLKV